MRNALNLLFCVVSLFSPAVGLAESNQIGPKPRVNVGIILPLTGESASIGNSIRNGMLMAFDQMSASQQAQLNLIFEDDQLNPNLTVTAFTKLTTMNHIDVLVTAYSGPSKAVSSSSERARIPQLSIASDPEIVRNKRYPVNFWVTPEEEARVTIEAALKRGYKRIARITAIQQGFLAIKQAFDKQNDRRLQIVLDEEYNPDTKDFRNFISKTKVRNDVDAVMVLLMVNGQIGVFAKQAEQLGLSVPLFNVEGFEDLEEQTIANGALTGQWYVTNADPSSEFMLAYRKRYPQASNFAAGNGYDSMLLLAAAVARNPSREGIRDYLHNVRNFSGALGSYSATGDNRFSLPAQVKVVPPLF